MIKNNVLRIMLIITNSSGNRYTSSGVLGVMFLANVGPTLTKNLFNVLQISLRSVILQLSSVFSLFICALGLFFLRNISCITDHCFAMLFLFSFNKVE